MEYKILSSLIINKLNETVQDHLNNGWELNGAPFTSGGTIYQGLIKTKKKSNQKEKE